MEIKRLYIEGEKNPAGHYLPDYLAHAIRYDSDKWAPNGIEAQIERTTKALGRTLAILNAKGILSDDEILELAGVEQRGKKITLKAD